ncbi:fasciclin domain-containing protein, partial [Lutibacter flavus]
MKTFKNLHKLVFIAFLAIAFVSCDDDDEQITPEPMTNSIADFVVANQDNYSSLLAALQKADLVETLQGEGPFTVFAPDNAAFAAFLTANNFNSLDDVPVAALKEILLNHVVSGSVQSGG